jgi:hypothetical protein
MPAEEAEGLHWPMGLLGEKGTSCPVVQGCCCLGQPSSNRRTSLGTALTSSSSRRRSKKGEVEGWLPVEEGKIVKRRRRTVRRAAERIREIKGTLLTGHGWPDGRRETGKGGCGQEKWANGREGNERVCVCEEEGFLAQVPIECAVGKCAVGGKCHWKMRGKLNELSAQ